jgi:hypothetical protein
MGVDEDRDDRMCGVMPLCTIRSDNEMRGISVFSFDCVLLYMVLFLLPVETFGLRVSYLGCLGERRLRDLPS